MLFKATLRETCILRCSVVSFTRLVLTGRSYFSDWLNNIQEKLSLDHIGTNLTDEERGFRVTFTRGKLSINTELGRWTFAPWTTAIFVIPCIVVKLTVVHGTSKGEENVRWKRGKIESLVNLWCGPELQSLVVSLKMSVITMTLHYFDSSLHCKTDLCVFTIDTAGILLTNINRWVIMKEELY